MATAGGDAIAIEAVSRVNGADGPNQVRAVAGVCPNIRHNEFFVMLGPSGCGKTTLLRTIAGFDTAERADPAGRSRVGELPPYNRPVNTVFQSYALFPHMTVAQNIAFGLAMHGPPKAEIAAKVAEMLRLVACPGWRAVRPASFPAASSSGWRWPGRWPSNRRCCCSTSRSPRSTSSSGRGCRPS